jgi:hypothetical protein
MAGRARNLRHRSGVLVGVGGVAFAVAFGLLLWFTRTERAALLRVPVSADTLDLARRAASMRNLLFRAESILTELSPPRRITPRVALSPSTVDSTSTDSIVRGDSGVVVAEAQAELPVAVTEPIAAQLPDSLRAALAALTARLQRAQNAPLAASWRALAADPLLQQDPRIRVLADSLADAERARNEYDAIGGVDPIYLELSSRVTAVGRSIERVAVARRASLLRQTTGTVVAQAVGPSAAEIARRYTADSTRYAVARERRDSAAAVSDTLARALSQQRADAQARDAARARAQRRVDALAPPLAMLTASAAAAAGLALLVTLLVEVRSPRLATDREVATQARVPVLLSIRVSDATTPDALTSAFSQLVFDLEQSLASSRTLVVVSDDPMLATRTAARIAERIGSDGRSVRVVSARHGTARMTTRSRRRATPTATQSVLVQPERNQGVAWTGEYFLDAVTEQMITVRAGTLDDVRASLATTEGGVRVLMVVRIGGTQTSWLSLARTEIHQGRGAEALGVVIWAADIEDTDPIAFALDTALQRALDAAPPTSAVR